jgi:hypothetical protein
MQAVLQWVMANTVEANQHGVVQWAGHGLHFAVTQDSADAAWLDEMLEVKDFYGSSKGKQPVAAVVGAMVKKQMYRRNNSRGSSSTDGESGLGERQLEMVREVELRSAKYGEGHLVRAGQGADEECERELEKEEEEEEEVEMEVPSAKARQEVDWPYAVALTAASAAELGRCTTSLQLLPLTDVAKQLLQPRCIGEIPWATGVYVTQGFVYAVEQLSAGGAASGSTCWNEYLRLVSDVLVLPSREVVLVSEREAEGLLELWLEQKGFTTVSGSSGLSSRVSARAGTATSSSAHLVSLSYALAAAGGGPLATALLPAAAAAAGRTGHAVVGKQGQELVNVPELVSMQLFNGGCSFASTEQRQWLRSRMRGRREAAEGLVSMRGTLPLFPRSHLEKACDVKIDESF